MWTELDLNQMAEHGVGMGADPYGIHAYMRARSVGFKGPLSSARASGFEVHPSL